jgi:CelD/BcsL family acetyltransferase involved in cellulose biosynthesis
MAYLGHGPQAMGVPGETDVNKLRVLHAATDRAEWLALWERWPQREPSAHPAYCAALAKDAVPIALHFASEAGEVLFPLHQRSIPGTDAVDLSDPYGYGGPFVLHGDPRALADAFWRAAHQWACDRDVVSLFGRPGFFDEGMAWPSGAIHIVGKHIVRDLRPSPDDLGMSVRHKVRKNVKRARRSGLTATVDESGEHLDEFLEIYESTLDRREASDRYYFGRELFETLVAEAPGTCTFFHVWNAEGRMVSSELVLTSRDHLYSFLGGTRAEAFADRPNDLLKWTVFEWGHHTGRTEFVLGAGTSQDDGIYRYKLAFAPDGEVDYRLGRLTLQPEMTARLVADRKAREPDWQPRDGWFPVYRS